MQVHADRVQRAVLPQLVRKPHARRFHGFAFVRRQKLHEGMNVRGQRARELTKRLEVVHFAFENRRIQSLCVTGYLTQMRLQETDCGPRSRPTNHRKHGNFRSLDVRALQRPQDAPSVLSQTE